MKSKQNKTELEGNEDIDYGFGGIFELEFSEIYDGDNQVHGAALTEVCEATLTCGASSICKS